MRIPSNTTAKAWPWQFFIILEDEQMKLLTEILSDLFMDAFAACGYEASLGTVVASARPELCQFQCNGALAGAKQYKKSPMQIANEVLQEVKGQDRLGAVEIAAPGFLNITLTDDFLMQYVEEVYADRHLGVPQATTPKTIG